MPEEKQTLITADVEPPSTAAPELRDRRPKPEGVVPKQSQAYVIAGLAVLILLAVLFSNNRAKPATKPSAAAPAVSPRRQSAQYRGPETRSDGRSAQERAAGTGAESREVPDPVSGRRPRRRKHRPRTIMLSRQPTATRSGEGCRAGTELQSALRVKSRCTRRYSSRTRRRSTAGRHQSASLSNR